MPATTNIGKLITRSPKIRGGRPRIAGTGISVRRIVGWYQLGLEPEEIARRIGHITIAQVYAALAYYHSNRKDIDADIKREAEEADRLERKFGRKRASK